MDQLQIIQLKSSWNVQGPYDVNSVLSYTFESCEGSNNSTQCEAVSPSAVHNMQLIPPQSEDNSPSSCQMWISCQRDAKTVAIEVISSARNIEFYDDQGGYCCTGRGSRMSGCEGHEEERVYKVDIVTERPLVSCSFKFLSLADKKQLCLKGVNVKLVHQTDESPHIGGSINMTRVREMMSSMSQPVSDRVENLMQTVEQYQKNQASVMDDLQQAALTRTVSSKDPMASQMTGLLSVLAKANSMQTEMARRTQPRMPPPHGGAATNVPDNSQVPPCYSNERTSADNDGGEEDSESATLVLTKLMSSLSTIGDSGNSSELGNNPDFYSAMQGMCRDLNRMKTQEGRRNRQRSGGGDAASGIDGEEKESSDIPQEKYPSSTNNSPLELRLLGYVASMEERLMGRLERKLEEVKDHIDVRLNRLEALLLEQACASKARNDEKDARSVNDEDLRKDPLQEEDLD